MYQQASFNGDGYVIWMDFYEQRCSSSTFVTFPGNYHGFMEVHGLYKPYEFSIVTYNKVPQTIVVGVINLPT